jgi:CBS domain containing-hemolysin-like protein
MILAAGLLVVLGSLLALAEASLSRVTRVRALMLQAEGRRHADQLVRIESDPTPHLNAVYLAVMFAQNGSAVLVALAAERATGELGVTIASVLFTLLYFVVVEAMSKSWGVLHSERVALALSPSVLVLARVLYLPTRLLVGLARWILPLREAKPRYEADIRSLADIGHGEGAIEELEREMIHSIFRLTDTIVREVQTPRPDIVSLPASATLDEAAQVLISSGYSRLPVVRGRLDDAVGFVHAKDVLRASHLPEPPATVGELTQPIRFVPESRPVAELLQEMRRERFHLALAVDEYGTVTGLVTLEDILEEIVGEIEDEHDLEEPALREERPGLWHVHAGFPVLRLNEALGSAFSAESWDTVGGLLLARLGRIPRSGDAAELQGYRLTAERVHGRRITGVRVERLEDPGGS